MIDLQFTREKYSIFHPSQLEWETLWKDLENYRLIGLTSCLKSELIIVFESN